MTYAPNYDVPENVSPFVPLPQLDLCAECRKPMEPLQAMSVVTEGRVRSGICSTCATNVTECDHPGIEHGPFSYTWPCPRCGICKFIGHGPLCGDCYATSVIPPGSTP